MLFALALASLLFLCRAAPPGGRLCLYGSLTRAGGVWQLPPSGCDALSVSRARFGPAGARQLGALLSNASASAELRTVEAASCCVGRGAGARHLAAGLAANARLLSWDLGNNQLADSGSIALAGGIAQNTVLTSLSLAHNKVGPRGAAALSAALANNSGSALRVLRLDGNKLGDAGAASFAAVTPLLLSRAAALAARSDTPRDDIFVSLNLDDNGVGDDGALAFAAALSSPVFIAAVASLAASSGKLPAPPGERDANDGNAPVFRLSLRYNPVSPPASAALASAAAALHPPGAIQLFGPRALEITFLRLVEKRSAWDSKDPSKALRAAKFYDARSSGYTAAATSYGFAGVTRTEAEGAAGAAAAQAACWYHLASRFAAQGNDPRIESAADAARAALVGTLDSTLQKPVSAFVGVFAALNSLFRRSDGRPLPPRCGAACAADAAALCADASGAEAVGESEAAAGLHRRRRPRRRPSHFRRNTRHHPTALLRAGHDPGEGDTEGGGEGNDDGEGMGGGDEL